MVKDRTSIHNLIAHAKELSECQGQRNEAWAWIDYLSYQLVRITSAQDLKSAQGIALQTLDELENFSY